MLALFISSLKITTLWRLFPAVFEVHSYPIKAVNLPGSLYFSAAFIATSHAERKAGSPGLESRASGKVPCEKAMMISTAALTPSWPPACTISYHFLPVGSASISGSPPNNLGKKPILSEWSATTRKSSGLDNFTGTPVEAISSSPLANRYASSGSSLAPNAPASMDIPVCRCVSPQYTLVGKLRPA